jgi:serine/threonine-protein kinase
MPMERIGHYTIVSELGRGGMGVVYLAHEESLNRYVAIKVLGEQLSDDPSFVARFTREAQAVAALSHPNIIQIFFIGEDQGRHYFVMEYVKGKSLLNMVKEQGKIENPRAAQYVLQAANGLAAAHDQGFVHRDIKPANLLISDKGLLKIADFGLALPAEAVTRLTATGMLVGTPGYLSPEQCMGETLDKRTDIYSLGVTFYELLTGTMPFRADSPLALLRKILQEEPPDVATLNTQVDEATRRIVNRMIAKDRTQRYQDCHELASDLGGYLGGTAKIPGVAGVVAPPPPAELEGATTRLPESGPQPQVAPAPGQTKPVSVPAAPAPEAVSAASAPASAAAAPAPAGVAQASAVAAATPPPAVPSAAAAPSAMVPAQQAMPVPAQVAAPAPHKSHAAVVVLAVLVVLVAAIAAGGYFALRSPLVQRYLPWHHASATSTEPQAAEQPADGSSTGAATSTTSETSSAAAPVQAESAGASSSSTGGTAAALGAGASAGATSSEGGTGGEAAPTTHHVPAAVEQRRARTTSRPAESTSGGEAGASSAAATSSAESAAPALAGVAVGATGEAPIAGIVASYLQSELHGAGLQALDAASLPDTEDMFGGGGSPAVRDVLGRLRGAGVAKLVLARVEAAGQRELRYMGRSDTAYTSRVTVTCYDVATGRPQGGSLSATFESTSLNQQQNTEKALDPLISQLVQRLR